MAAAGYSATPLVRKLGLRAGARCLVIDRPEPYASYGDLVRTLPDDARVTEGPAAPDDGPLDFVHLFARRAERLDALLCELRARIAPDGTIWVSWPKKASGVETDLSSGAVRAAGLAAGLVDVKVCAVDEVWSGLKFVIRREDRPGAGGER